MLIAKNQDKTFLDFIICKLISAPEVYNLSGLTLVIDDFLCSK